MTFPMLRFPVFLLLVAAAQCIPSSPLSTRLRASTRLGAPISECASLPNYPQWFQPSEKFDNGDCSRAISIFYHDYVKDHGPIPYEFLTSGVDPVHGIPTQRVPLKVGFGERSYRMPTKSYGNIADIYKAHVKLRSLCAANSDGAICRAKDRSVRQGPTSARSPTSTESWKTSTPNVPSMVECLDGMLRVCIFGRNICFCRCTADGSCRRRSRQHWSLSLASCISDQPAHQSKDWDYRQTKQHNKGC